jgi:hypothetical protein
MSLMFTLSAIGLLIWPLFSEWRKKRKEEQI